MAKEETIKEVTLENVEESIREGRVVTPEIAKEAAERVAKRRKEELTEELIAIATRGEYMQKHAYLTMKKTDKDAKAKREYLKKFTDIYKKLCEGGISVEEFKKQSSEEKKTCSKNIRENDNWFSEQLDALNKLYPDSWMYRQDIYFG